MKHKSSVAIYFASNLYQKFLNKLKRLKLQSENSDNSLYYDVMSLIEQCHTHVVNERYGSALFYWENISFGINIDECRIFYSLMNSSLDIYYLFIRIGDELQDFEVKGETNGNIFSLSLGTIIEFKGKNLVE
jgi:hypothetical protein